MFVSYLFSEYGVIIKVSVTNWTKSSIIFLLSIVEASMLIKINFIIAHLIPDITLSWILLCNLIIILQILSILLLFTWLEKVGSPSKAWF